MDHELPTEDRERIKGIALAHAQVHGMHQLRTRQFGQIRIIQLHLEMAEWLDFDLDAGEWRFTGTKTGTPHIVPLSTQAVAILREFAPYRPRAICLSGE